MKKERHLAYNKPRTHSLLHIHTLYKVRVPYVCTFPKDARVPYSYVLVIKWSGGRHVPFAQASIAIDTMKYQQFAGIAPHAFTRHCNHCAISYNTGVL